MIANRRRWPLCIVAMLLGHLEVAQLAEAKIEPQVRTEAGLLVIAFAAPEGAVTTYLPDDVAAGESFSGTLEGPRGFVLKLGDQRARTGRTFRWEVPAGESAQNLPVVLLNPAGTQIARVFLHTRAAAIREPAFRCPALIHAGSPFPVRGPFDGDSRTTRVMVGRRSAPPLVESLRKAIFRAPSDIVGPTSCTLTEGRMRHRSKTRSLSIAMGPPASSSPQADRELIVGGLRGIDRDVPLQIGDDYFYLRSTEIPDDGTFSTRRSFPAARNDIVATLVIPQSRRDEVAVILRTPQRDPTQAVARQRADALRSLEFDAFVVTGELFADDLLGADAAYALLAADERRALALILDSIPQSGLAIQFLGFAWFLDHAGTVRADAARQAHEAALRALTRVVSSGTAELALHVLGLTGSDADWPLLEKFYAAGGVGISGMRDASEASLVRLGSREHLEKIRAELAPPLPRNASYSQGVRLALALRKAGLTGHVELIPVICAHVTDPVILEIDITVDPATTAANALSAIVDGIPVPAKRPLGDWQSYCRTLSDRPPPPH